MSVLWMLLLTLVWTDICCDPITEIKTGLNACYAMNRNQEGCIAIWQKRLELEMLMANFVRAEEAHNIAKEAHVLAKEEHVRAEEVHDLAKEEHVRANEAHDLAKEAHVLSKEAHEWKSNDRKNLIDFPGLTVDTSSGMSVSVALMSVVMILAASLLQCCATDAVWPMPIIAIFLAFSIGLDFLFWMAIPTQWIACGFIVIFATVTAFALSFHFIYAGRMKLAAVWSWKPPSP